MQASAVQSPLTRCNKQSTERKPRPGLVHHSDRGVQYASDEYIALLREHGAICSMSRVGNPYDNAMCESFLKTLKQEEIYCHEYRDLDDLRRHGSAFIDGYYNTQTSAFSARLCVASCLREAIEHSAGLRRPG